VRLFCPLRSFLFPDSILFWEIVKENYDSNRVAFIYGGDRIHSKKNERHLEHLEYHSEHGICFVRELDI